MNIWEDYTPDDKCGDELNQKFWFNYESMLFINKENQKIQAFHNKFINNPSDDEFIKTHHDLIKLIRSGKYNLTNCGTYCCISSELWDNDRMVEKHIIDRIIKLQKSI